MKNKEFMEQLSEVQDLMNQEKYKEAIKLIQKLKEIDKKGDFDYDLAHKLYQLDSNCNSLYNQQIILTLINKFSTKQKTISFNDLNRILKENEDLNLTDEILKREIELLILRNLLDCKIEGNNLIF